MSRTPEMRMANLLRGGTIHQLAMETGVPSQELLYGEPAPAGENHYSHGRLAAEAMALVSRRSLIPETHGDREFWLGVALSNSQAE